MKDAINAFFNVLLTILNSVDEDGASYRILSLFQRRINGALDLFGITDETLG